MQRHELLTPGGQLPEIGIEGNAGDFALEIQREGFPINGIVQNSVTVMEDVEFGDC